MADLQKVSQVIAEVATLNSGKQKTSQIIAEVATLNAGKQKVSQIIAEVAYIVGLTATGTGGAANAIKASRSTSPSAKETI